MDEKASVQIAKQEVERRLEEARKARQSWVGYGGRTGCAWIVVLCFLAWAGAMALAVVGG